MKALIMNAVPGTGGCDNANSDENRKGEVGTFPTVSMGKSGNDHE
jgi:hypothetical protein